MTNPKAKPPAFPAAGHCMSSFAMVAMVRAKAPITTSRMPRDCMGWTFAQCNPTLAAMLFRAQRSGGLAIGILGVSLARRPGKLLAPGPWLAWSVLLRRA